MRLKYSTWPEVSIRAKFWKAAKLELRLGGCQTAGWRKICCPMAINWFEKQQTRRKSYLTRSYHVCDVLPDDGKAQACLPNSGLGEMPPDASQIDEKNERLRLTHNSCEVLTAASLISCWGATEQWLGRHLLPDGNQVDKKATNSAQPTIGAKKHLVLCGGKARASVGGQVRIKTFLYSLRLR